MDILKGISYEKVKAAVKERLKGLSPESCDDGYVDVAIEFDSKLLDDLGIRDKERRGDISIIDLDEDFIWFWAIVRTPYVRKKDKGNIGHYFIADSEACDTIRFCSPKLYRAIKEVCDAGLKKAYRDFVSEMLKEE